MTDRQADARANSLRGQRLVQRPIHYPGTHMTPLKVAAACGLVALLISGCGIPPKPVAGTAQLRKHAGFYGLRDDPRIPQAKCLRRDKLPYREYYADGAEHLPAIQVGNAPQGPTIIFYPTAGIAQGLQIMGKESGAEVIGSLLVYPNQAHHKILTKVEDCAAIGVPG